MKGAGVPPGEFGGGEEFQPELSGAQGEGEHSTGGLADGPDHAEVADRGGGGVWGFFEDGDGLTGSGGEGGVGQAEDAGADDGDVCTLGRGRHRTRVKQRWTGAGRGGQGVGFLLEPGLQWACRGRK